MPSKVLDEARDLVRKRLAELEDERRRLERALSELNGKAGGSGRGRRPGRPRSSGRPASKKAATRPRRTRRRRSNTRADQAVSLVEKNPGISASEIAKSMKIKPNYLYRVLGDLEKEGRVKKQGRKYQPGQAAKSGKK
jgi:sugar-specific transcriptional regulator TrmB